MQLLSSGRIENWVSNMKIEGYRPGYSLPQEFYKDADIYRSEVANIFHKHWMFACHAAQIPRAGDFITVQLGAESIIVVRTQNGDVKAHMNVCRHRGSRLCLEEQGRKKLFTCPYHAWSYDLDGNLMVAREMPTEFIMKENGLHAVYVELIGGLIFISLAEKPLSLSNLRKDLNPLLDLFGFDNLKLAMQKRYAIPANWKLAVENYQECYHCTPSHKEFAQIHAMARDVESFKKDKTEFLARQKGNPKIAEFNCYFERAALGQEGYQYDRNPLLPGNLSGSLGGKPVAPLLGKLTEYDEGASELMVGPMMFFLIYDDHVVGYRFAPTTIDSCVCDIFWFVHEAAEEGVDYNLPALTWLWDVTTIADKTIIENNQKGVNSRFYSPGRLSKMEDFQQSFLNWYVQSIHTVNKEDAVKT
ncbi:MAG: aromatic ring-hydroxylating dioxygenase subunit alpha [Hellea sp.]